MTTSLEHRRLLAVIPAFNEQGAIRRVVAGVREILPEADVLVVDDGSSDRTTEEAEAAGALVVRHPFNLGIGATVQTGLRFACEEDYEIVFRLDGDGQHNSADLPQLFAALCDNRVDSVFGSRFLGMDSTMKIPVARRLGISCFRTLVTMMTGQRVTDSTSGLCCFNRRAVDVLAKYLPQDYPEVEGRVVLHKAGLASVEVPVQMLPRTTGASSIDGWRSIYYALKVSLAVLITGIKDIPPAAASSAPERAASSAPERAASSAPERAASSAPERAASSAPDPGSPILRTPAFAQERSAEPALTARQGVSKGASVGERAERSSYGNTV